MMNGFIYHYHLGESTLILRGIRSDFKILFHFSVNLWMRKIGSEFRNGIRSLNTFRLWLTLLIFTADKNFCILHGQVFVMKNIALLCRCILSDVIVLKLTQDKILESDLFQDLVKKDLLYNVYRDGVWGSYRHLPIDTGEYHLSLCVRKPTIWVSDQVRHKPGCTSTEDG